MFYLENSNKAWGYSLFCMEKGITLIALVITVIVLLILAGVATATLTGENGILTQTGSAKEETEIEREKEIISLSLTGAKAKENYSHIEKSELQEQLDKYTGEGKTDVIDNGYYLVVKFNESNRYYEIDSNGNISDVIYKEEISYAGDITKNGTCDGSQSNPYQINCIEDLFAFSNNVNSGITYENNVIILKRDLDFESIFSYNDYKTTEYGDLNKNGKIEYLIEELTNKNDGAGFKPIGSSQFLPFNGTFDGNNFSVRNIFINLEYTTHQYYVSCGLFGYNSGMIENLVLDKGMVNSANVNATGGICGTNHGKIINCINRVTVNAVSNAGGISGRGGRYF